MVEYLANFLGNSFNRVLQKRENFFYPVLANTSTTHILYIEAVNKVKNITTILIS